ncbi:cystathionine beta-lyase [Haemophilus influenzae]|nr:cystathionine beta-lyase [Haemophilus influenzae]AXP76841.1 cystathionine beta-lyase [Haemophilus influenzae]MDF9920556.1 cystathionine beta-lyase [Haemophilus influenzae]RFN79979.1 cystathionine beta-lyase [Haemophilus influenzae]RFO73400.1 cystathionine beta-lyase [Haemophilus influenzae]
MGGGDILAYLGFILGRPLGLGWHPFIPFFRKAFNH